MIPPHAKERLVFRASSGPIQSQLHGILTMCIENASKQDLMFGFKIDRGRFTYSSNRFSFGFPDADWSLQQKKKLEKRTGDFFATWKFHKADEQQHKELCYPKDCQTGDFYLSCLLGSGSHSRCAAVLSKY